MRTALAPTNSRNVVRLVAFLKGDVLPHARSEERHLYPMVNPLVRQHGKPTATMEIDHEFITSYISRIEQAAHELETSRDTDRAQLLGRLGCSRRVWTRFSSFTWPRRRGSTCL